MIEIKNHIKRKTKVYSLEYGAGEIVKILNLHDGIEDYIEVKFYNEETELKVFPNKFKNDLRIISKPIELAYVLKSLKLKITNADSNDDVSIYQSFGVDADLDLLVNIIANLIGRLNLKLSDKELLAQCLESLVLEVGHVFKINDGCARGIVEDYTRVA